MITDIQRLTAGQYIDVKTLCVDPFNDLHLMCAILCQPCKDKEYRGESVPERAKFFYENMPVQIAYPLMMFFFRLLEALNTNIQGFLKTKVLEGSQ